jgi:AP-3 complex subunit delta-1
MSEIKEELTRSDPVDKSNAIKKLVYLQMIGYDMSWAAFPVIEVMGAQWYGHRRIGYLAASVSYTQETDVLILATHIFRKAFTGGSAAGASSAGGDGQIFEAGSALSCLANVVTPDLAKDLLNDVYSMMNSSHPYLRKKAVLVLFRICIRWPQALRLSFNRLKDKLDDDHQGVVSAAVYVICELAERNSRNYLPLAPQFFKILTSSSNNWVLIKVVKLLGSLVPLEPRLAKKLVDPLTDIITTTPAKSLLYECVNTLLKGRLTSKSVIRLCLEKLRTFIEDPDQNLKYLGLLGLHKLMQKHPSVVAEHKDLILNCLGDEDVTIRQRALDLITSMVSKKNLVGIIRRLTQHLEVSEGTYRDTVLERIVHICSQEDYAFISDFAWYVSTLVELTNSPSISVDNAQRISTQLQDVIIRVPAVREYGVAAMIDV